MSSDERQRWQTENDVRDLQKRVGDLETKVKGEAGLESQVRDVKTALDGIGGRGNGALQDLRDVKKAVADLEKASTTNQGALKGGRWVYYILGGVLTLVLSLLALISQVRNFTIGGG